MKCRELLRKLGLGSALIENLQIVDDGDRSAGGIVKMTDHVIGADIIIGDDFHEFTKARCFALQ
ncbi:hypothetical protein D3C86_2206590 [compost metagenome]